MKALMYKGPRKMEIVDLQKPIPQEGELLLKIKACGICGSDVHGYLGITGRRTAPMVMGHEFSAEVAGLGEGTTGDFHIGDRVVVQPCLSCWKCEKCREGYNNVCDTRRFLGVMDCNGAMQEYLCVPEKVVYKLPDNMSYSMGALIEAIAVAYSGVKKAGDLSGKNIVIIGAGTIGQLALKVVKTKNPKKVVISDLSDFRLEIAKKMGADITVNPGNEDFMEKVRSAFDGNLADISIEAVGISATVGQAIAALKPQGTCVWLGNSAKMIELNMQSVVTQELKIYGSYIYTHKDFGETIDFINKNNLDLSAIISKEITLEEAPQMFEELTIHTDKYLKCIIKF